MVKYLISRLCHNNDTASYKIYRKKNELPSADESSFVFIMLFTRPKPGEESAS